MRFRFFFVAVAIAVISAGGSAFATWQFAKRQVGAQDTLTMLVAARPKDKPTRFQVKVDDARVRFYRTPEDRMAADLSVLVVAVQRDGTWVPVGNP